MAKPLENSRVATLLNLGLFLPKRNLARSQITPPEWFFTLRPLNKEFRASPIILKLRRGLSGCARWGLVWTYWEWLLPWVEGRWLSDSGQTEGLQPPRLPGILPAVWPSSTGPLDIFLTLVQFRGLTRIHDACFHVCSFFPLPFVCSFCLDTKRKNQEVCEKFGNKLPTVDAAYRCVWFSLCEKRISAASPLFLNKLRFGLRPVF